MVDEDDVALRRLWLDIAEDEISLVGGSECHLGKNSDAGALLNQIQNSLNLGALHL